MAKERRVTFGHHLPSTRLAGVPRGVTDNDQPALFGAPERFAQRGLIVFGVMERRVEYDSVKLLVVKGEVSAFCLKSRKKFVQVSSIMCSGPEAILVVGEQVHGDRTIPCKRKTIAHPAITSAKIQYLLFPVLLNLLPYMLDQVVVSSCPDTPLLGISSRGVGVGKTEIELLTLAATPLCNSDALIVLHKLCVIDFSLWRDGVHDIIDDF